MSKKGKPKKNEEQELGPAQSSDSSDTTQPPGDMNDDADPPNRTVLAAIAALRSEVAQIKGDICSSIDARIQTVCTELRGELATTKKEIQTSITALEGNTSSHEKTIKDLERSASLQSDDITALQSQVTRLNSEVDKLVTKCEDLEGRSRRHNIRIIGIPEGAEGSAPHDFVADLLQEVLSLEAKPLIDRAHRTLCRRPDPQEPPRPIVLRLHYYHVLEGILRKAIAARQLFYEGKRIQIFPDYPPAVAKRRALFNRARELLRDRPGVKYGLLYPARLLVTFNGTQTSFTDAKKAEEYAEGLFAPKPSTSTNDMESQE
ncbi:uncharacterized protein LOC125286061 [Alosa alosa]|uniref:uncharacterized protein LOC125286061 n=1 Tax=Alosa alosa TaxID=278164 RepID=UPI002015097B|nr:uncharacterized protein LOC125286061 [Alosa alosa]